MSTLVKIVMAVTMQLFNGGPTQEESLATTNANFSPCELNVQQLNPHYIITNEELLAQPN